MTLRLTQVHRVVKDYSRDLPGWTIHGKDRLIRVDVPVVQGILFNRSSGDDYRPFSYVQILTVPDVNPDAMELPRQLLHRNGAPRSVRLGLHERERDDVVSEMYRQFRPALDRQFSAGDVLDLYETMAVPTLNQTRSLATFHAYMGHDGKAEEWCDCFHRLMASPNHFPVADDREWTQFMNSLRGWIANGVARQELTHFVHQNLEVMGL